MTSVDNLTVVEKGVDRIVVVVVVVVGIADVAVAVGVGVVGSGTGDTIAEGKPV